MCPSSSTEALRGHINVPFVYKELKLWWGDEGHNIDTCIVLLYRALFDFPEQGHRE